MNSRDEHVFRFGHKDLCILMEGVTLFWLLNTIYFFEHATTIYLFEFALDGSELILLPLFVLLESFAMDLQSPSTTPIIYIPLHQHH